MHSGFQRFQNFKPLVLLVRSSGIIRQIAYVHLLTLVINAGYNTRASKFCLIGSHTTFTTPATPQLSSASSNMINSSKYVFVETKSSWIIGSHHHSLSFSSDGTTLTGTEKVIRVNKEFPTFRKTRVQLWETATGDPTSSFEHSSLVVFSPTDPDMAILVRPGSVHMLKRDSFRGKTWGGQTKHDCDPDALCTFNSDGRTVVMSWDRKCLQEYDPTTPAWSKLTKDAGSFVSNLNITTVVCCPIKPGLFIVGDHRGQLEVVSSTYHTFQSYCRLIPVEPVRVSACAWSQDGKWIATGNAVGDVFLWNAGVPTKVSFAMHLPRTTVTRTFNLTTSLIFMQDSAALIIICDGCLSVWDIYNAEYVSNSGLPSMATNIALDGPRNRLAVAVDDRITIYELELPEEMMDGKNLPFRLKCKAVLSKRFSFVTMFGFARPL